MSYEKNTWAKGDVVTSAKLNHMEDGIANAGVLVVGTTEEDNTIVLDKTWQEIYDSPLAVVRTPLEETDETGYATMLVTQVWFSPDTSVLERYKVTIAADEPITFRAETAGGYPSYNFQN